VEIGSRREAGETTLGSVSLVFGLPSSPLVSLSPLSLYLLPILTSTLLPTLYSHLTMAATHSGDLETGEKGPSMAFGNGKGEGDTRLQQ
jgi:hypothetical protein